MFGSSMIKEWVYVFMFFVCFCRVFVGFSVFFGEALRLLIEKTFQKKMFDFSKLPAFADFEVGKEVPCAR